MKTRPIASIFATALLACLSVAACSEQFPKQKPTPVVPTVTPPPSQAIRTIEQRSIFGAAGEANLMADGDFELTGRSQQMPWLTFGDQGQGTLNYETGGRCRTGIRCAVLRKDEQLIGWFASPKTGSITATLYVYPNQLPCREAASAIVLDLDEQQRGAELTAAAEPDVTGWCKFESVAPAIPFGSPVLYVQSKSEGVRFDSARVIPTSAKLQTQSSLIGWRTLSAAQRTKVSSIATVIRATRVYGVNKTPSVDNLPPELTRAQSR
jgi:hypothetical protein